MTPSRYLTLCLGGCAIAAALVLPSPVREAEMPNTSLEAAIDAAEIRFDLQSELLRREYSRAIATAAVNATRNSTSLLSVVPGRVDPSFAHAMSDAVGEHLAHYSRASSGARVVLAFTTAGSGEIAGVPDQRSSVWIGVDVFPPGSIADDVCVAVARVGPDFMLRILRTWTRQLRSQIADPCRWYVGYGKPGAGIQRWLDSTRHAAAKHSTTSDLRNYVALSVGQRLDKPSFARRNAALAACSAGRERACEDAVLNAPRDTYRGDAILDTRGWIGNRGWTTYWNPVAAAMLTQLERELGPVGFAAFWSSDQDVPAAFRAARGEDLGTWVRAQVNANSHYNSGPLPTSIMMLGVLVSVPALIAVGIRGVTHRGRFS